MPYKKDPFVVSLFWGRIGAVLLALIAFALGLFGYAMTPEDVETGNELITGIFAGIAAVLILISKIRESKKAE